VLGKPVGAVRGGARQGGALVWWCGSVSSSFVGEDKETGGKGRKSCQILYWEGCGQRSNRDVSLSLQTKKSRGGDGISASDILFFFTPLGSVLIGKRPTPDPLLLGGLRRGRFKDGQTHGRWVGVKRDGADATDSAGCEVKKLQRGGRWTSGRGEEREKDGLPAFVVALSAGDWRGNRGRGSMGFSPPGVRRGRIVNCTPIGVGWFLGNWGTGGWGSGGGFAYRGMPGWPGGALILRARFLGHGRKGK